MLAIPNRYPVVAAILLTFVCQGAEAVLYPIEGYNLLGDATVIDFTGTPPVTTVVQEDDPLFTSNSYSRISSIGPHSVSSIDILDDGIASNALAVAATSLVIAAPGDFFGTSMNQGGGLRFDVNGTATQLGFRVRDQTLINLQVRTYMNDVLLETWDFYESSSFFPLNARYFQETNPFDRWELVCNDPYCYGWGLDNITLAGITQPVSTSIAEPATVVLMGLGLVGLGWAARRKLRR